MIHLAYKRILWRALVKLELNLWYREREVTSWSAMQLSALKKYLTSPYFASFLDSAVGEFGTTDWTE
jgi:hypothetical protein